MSTDKILLQNVRLSFPSLFRKSLMKGETDESKAQYSATLILDKKDHAKDIKRIERMVLKCAEAKFGIGKVPKKLKSALLDGDDEDAEELEGKFFIRAATKSVRPTVVDRYKNQITEEDDIIYAGCFVHATISFWSWDHPTGGKGVSANLRAVMFAKDGEPFGASAADADEEFEDLPDYEDDIDEDDIDEDDALG